MKHNEVMRVALEFQEWLNNQEIYLETPDDGGYDSYPPDESPEELAKRFARERRRG